MGVHDLQNDDFAYDIEEIVIHSKYKNKKLHYDIGLIRLAQNVDFSSDRVQMVCLMNQKIPMRKNDRYSVTGWGYTSMK